MGSALASWWKILFLDAMQSKWRWSTQEMILQPWTGTLEQQSSHKMGMERWYLLSTQVSLTRPKTLRSIKVGSQQTNRRLRFQPLHVFSLSDGQKQSQQVWEWWLEPRRKLLNRSPPTSHGFYTLLRINIFCDYQDLSHRAAKRTTWWPSCSFSGSHIYCGHIFLPYNPGISTFDDIS